MLNLPIEIWIVLVGVLFICAFLWLMLTEWSYLGSGFVRRSYDWMAPWYEGKWKSEEYQSDALNKQLFIEPILNSTGNDPGARVLDLACGTGRVSILLLKEPGFAGQIEAIDFSDGMLKRFRGHLAELDSNQNERADLKQLDLGDWVPVRPEMFDAVLFLEAAELIPRLPKLLSQVFAAVKPGGVLITTQVGSRFVWLFRGRHQRGDAMQKLLVKNGFDILSTSHWRPRYDVIIARRSIG